MIKTVNFIVGDIVRVHERVVEPVAESQEGKGKATRVTMKLNAGRTRTQVFEGTVLAIKGRGENKSFTVMKIVGDVGVEKIFPIMSPNVEKVVLKAHSKKKIRRAKLYYLRLPKPV